MAASNKIATKQSRMEDPRSVCIEFNSALSCASFHMKFVDLDAQAAARIGHIAATDGQTVYSGPKFETHRPPEQRFFFLHEMLHGAFSHGPRAKILQQSQGASFDAEIWNIACDALINHALRMECTKNSRVEMPKGLVDFGSLMYKLGRTKENSGEEVNRLLPSYSTETLYYELLKRHKETCGAKQQQKGQPGNSNSPQSGSSSSPKPDAKDVTPPNKPQPNASGQPQSEQSATSPANSPSTPSEANNQPQDSKGGQSPNSQAGNSPNTGSTSNSGTNGEPSQECGDGSGSRSGQSSGRQTAPPPPAGPQSAPPKEHSTQCPCHSSGSLHDVVQPSDFDDNGNPQSPEDLMRDWMARLSVLRGLNPEFFNRLAGEFPEVKTPWEDILREYLHRFCGPRIETNWSRPSRRYSAIAPGYSARHGCDFPFEAGRDRPKVTANIAIVLDTSGSVDATLLNRFLGEVASVIETTDSKITLITCDAKVHETHEIEEFADAETLRGLKYSGGGGTSFGPGIAEAMKSEPDAIIYLTDLYGDFGEEPSVEVLWAVPLECNASPEEPPFGRLLELE